MVDAVVREVRPEDSAEISALHARAFGPGRYARTAYRIREGKGAFSRYCRVCLIDGRIIAAVRFTPITIGGKDGALLLGPLAVDPALKNAGIGSALMRHAVTEAARLGHGAILLVGDAPYYGRFGFSAAKTGALAMPGPYERHRLLALELTDGALDGAQGTLRAAGRKLKALPLTFAA